VYRQTETRALTLLQHEFSLTGDVCALAGSNSLLWGQVKAVPAAVMGLVFEHVAACTEVTTHTHTHTHKHGTGLREGVQGLTVHVCHDERQAVLSWILQLCYECIDVCMQQPLAEADRGGLQVGLAMAVPDVHSA